jgi:hypothetical protein
MYMVNICFPYMTHSAVQESIYNKTFIVQIGIYADDFSSHTKFI